MSVNTKASFMPISWELPANVGAVFTTRLGGSSHPPYDSFNLGVHVGDEPDSVAKNRQLLQDSIGIDDIHWLRQVHGNNVLEVTHDFQAEKEADAAWTSHSGRALVIQVADCMPVLVTDKRGSIVGAAHAGWRSLCAGVIQRLLDDMNLLPREARVWLGPCIGPSRFEVGPDVFNAFMASPFFLSANVDAAFLQGEGDRLFADLQLLAKSQLAQLGCESISSDPLCTHSDPETFYSYRRDGTTGRHGALIWINHD